MELMLHQNMDGELLELMNGKARSLADEQQMLTERLKVLERETEISRDVPSERWNASSYEEKREVSRLLIEKITILPDASAEVMWNL